MDFIVTYAFCPLQRRQTAQSFGDGAEEERRPPSEAAAAGWRHARFGRERRQCDCMFGWTGAAHGGTRALGGTGGRGGPRGVFGSHGVV